MAHSNPSAPEEQLHLGLLAPKWVRLGLILAALGFGGGVSQWLGGSISSERFFHAYLIAVVYFVALCLGALFFVQLQHLTRAGWSVVVRRLAELMSTALPILGLLLVPILVLMAQKSSVLYMWVDPAAAEHEPVLLKKAAYLNPSFFIVRTVLYVAVWTFFSQFFFRNSRRQDDSGDLALTYKMQWVAAPAIAAFVLSTSFFAFDYLMSLEPTFYSTIFGIYFFSGCCITFLSTTIVLSMMLQRAGILGASLTTEHYHDLGKLLFGFIFFWGYVAFSQYMLIWYGNIPEETLFFFHRQQGSWTYVSLALLFGHLLLPYPGLISRHVKRNGFGLAFWATWMLAMEYLDLYWLIMPSLGLQGAHGEGEGIAPPQFGLVEVSLWVGVLGVMLIYMGIRGKSVPLRPLRDPRLEESLAFENI